MTWAEAAALAVVMFSFVCIFNGWPWRRRDE